MVVSSTIVLAVVCGSEWKRDLDDIIPLVGAVGLASRKQEPDREPRRANHNSHGDRRGKRREPLGGCGGGAPANDAGCDQRREDGSAPRPPNSGRSYRWGVLAWSRPSWCSVSPNSS